MIKVIFYLLIVVRLFCCNYCIAQQLFIKTTFLQPEPVRILNFINALYKKNKISEVRFQKQCREYYQINTVQNTGSSKYYDTLLIYTEVNYKSKWQGTDCVYTLRFFRPSNISLFWNFQYSMTSESDYGYEGSVIYYNNNFFIRNETYCDDVVCDTKVYQSGKIIYNKSTSLNP